MVQEEMEQRTVQLAIQTAKLTLRVCINALKEGIAKIRSMKEGLENSTDTIPTGRQTVKELTGQGQRISSVDISDESMKKFFKSVRKFGVDYAIVKDKSGDKPMYTIFFKANDTDVFDAIIKDCLNKQLDKDKTDPLRKEKPSIIEALKKIKEMIAKAPSRIKEKKKELER